MRLARLAHGGTSSSRSWANHLSAQPASPAGGGGERGGNGEGGVLPQRSPGSGGGRGGPGRPPPGSARRSPPAGPPGGARAARWRRVRPGERGAAGRGEGGERSGVGGGNGGQTDTRHPHGPAPLRSRPTAPAAAVERLPPPVGRQPPLPACPRCWERGGGGGLANLRFFVLLFIFLS